MDMFNRGKSIVEIPESFDSRFKSWRKLLENVDRSKSNGYAFEGVWLKGGTKAEIVAGSYVLGYDEEGSRNRCYPHITLWKENNGNLESVFDWAGTKHLQKDWALNVRDKIADIVETKEDEPEYEALDFTEEDLGLIEQMKIVLSKIDNMRHNGENKKIKAILSHAKKEMDEEINN